MGDAGRTCGCGRPVGMGSKGSTVGFLDRARWSIKASWPGGPAGSGGLRPEQGPEGEMAIGPWAIAGKPGRTAAWVGPV
jgi:hypothetical protein